MERGQSECVLVPVDVHYNNFNSNNPSLLTRVNFRFLPKNGISPAVVDRRSVICVTCSGGRTSSPLCLNSNPYAFTFCVSWATLKI